MALTEQALCGPGATSGTPRWRREARHCVGLFAIDFPDVDVDRLRFLHADGAEHAVKPDLAAKSEVGSSAAANLRELLGTYVLDRHLDRSA